MTVQGFMFLLIAAIVGITVGAHFAEKWTPPGFQRTVTVAVIAAAILFPAARFAERLGWIRGRLDLTRRDKGKAVERADGDDAPGSPESDRTDGDRRS
jgi:uncharacterized membrane protein YfcA